MSTYDLSDSRLNQPNPAAVFRSHHDLTLGQTSADLDDKHSESPEPFSQREMLEEVREASPSATLPRVNFHKKHRAPTPPIRQSQHDVSIDDKMDGYSTGTKKRMAPKPNFVSKVSITPAEDTTNTHREETTPAVTLQKEETPVEKKVEKVDYQDKLEEEVTVSVHHCSTSGSSNQNSIIENPVYVTAASTSQTKVETRDDRTSRKTEEGTIVTTTALLSNPKVHVTSIKVRSEDDIRTATLPVAESVKDRKAKSNDETERRQRHHHQRDQHRPKQQVSRAESPVVDKATKMSSESVTGKMPKVDSEEKLPMKAQDQDNRTKLEPKAVETNGAVCTANSIPRSRSPVVVSPAPRVISCTEVQINSQEQDSQGRGVIKIRSGYDISSVARRTQVIGGGKVKETASLLNESTILSGLRQLPSNNHEQEPIYSTNFSKLSNLSKIEMNGGSFNNEESIGSTPNNSQIEPKKTSTPMEDKPPVSFSL